MRLHFVTIFWPVFFREQAWMTSVKSRFGRSRTIITSNNKKSNGFQPLEEFFSSSFLISFRFPPVGVKFLSFYIFFPASLSLTDFFSRLSCVCPRVWSHSVEEGGAGRAIAERYIIWPRCPSLGDSTHRRVDDGAGAKEKKKRTRPTADCWEITKKIKVVRGHSKISEQEKKSGGGERPPTISKWNPSGADVKGEKEKNRRKEEKKHERLQPCYSRRGSNVPDNDYEYKYVKSSALYFFSPPSVYLLLGRSLRPTLVPPSCASSAFLSLSLSAPVL